MKIGETIRQIRNRKRITISELCEATGLSKGFISQVENGKTSPSISTLQTIADFLNVPLPYLLLEPQNRMHVVKQQQRHISTFGENGIRIEHLTAQSFQGLRMMIAYLPVNTATGDKFHAHAGEECHLVLRGKILAQQGEDEAVLEEGDSFSWQACVPHRVENIGEETAVVLIAVHSATSTDAVQGS